MAQNPSVYIIVLNYNGYEDTIECVNSLERINYNNKHIVIVDNCSTDNSEQILREHFKEHKLIQTNNNIGYAGGNNIGIEYALNKNADYIMILNNDTVVEENILNVLLEGFKQPNVGVVVPKILYYDNPTIVNSFGAYKTKLGKILNIGQGDKDNKEYSQNMYVDYAMGCCMLFDRNVLKKVGLFNEEYFMYLEESDLFERIKHEYKTLVIGNARILHKGEKSSKGKNEINYFAKYYINRNRLLYCDKNMKFLSGNILKICYFIKDILNILVNLNDKILMRIILMAWKDYMCKRFYKNEDIQGILTKEVD